MSLNAALALLSAVLWLTAYGGYFRHDIRAWWWRRTHAAELRRLRQAHSYAAFLRRTSAARYRRWTPPAPPPRAPHPHPAETAVAPARPAAARPSAQVIPFPAERRRRTPPS